MNEVRPANDLLSKLTNCFGGGDGGISYVNLMLFLRNLDYNKPDDYQIGLIVERMVRLIEAVNKK